MISGSSQVVPDHSALAAGNTDGGRGRGNEVAEVVVFLVEIKLMWIRTS